LNVSPAITGPIPGTAEDNASIVFTFVKSPPFAIPWDNVFTAIPEIALSNVTPAKAISILY
jgi:hypothetical protein